ncbi:Sec1-like protein [Gonapodya prolifera JEL478]|uniref:Sec1-like protein n=1 Tax=Gonapodya prolifera (strain JEL478) TaxID=1344416 RepID=A0A138ZZT6_GONPJ|nr:Sec1-like protein [Gonapodya prolifera JEL478]|eukprot:KXS09653.1 Sec1-like protein [Gonapodya prolifera JEL478]
MVRAVQPPGKWKLLVVDHTTLRILNSCAKMSDVLEENVTLVESIERKRQPYPNMDAIYFIAPNRESVTRLAEDITAAKQMYAGGHVFFSGVLPDALHTQLNIAKRQNRPFVRIQRELALDFTMFESSVFLVEPEDPTSGAPSADHRDRGLASQADVERMGSKIASVLLTLGETTPTIHYYSPNSSNSSSPIPTSQTNRRNQPPPVGQSLAALAASVAQQLSYLAKLDAEYQSAATPRPNRDGPATVVLVDRSIDVLQCLMHDFCYQGAAVDLVGWEGAGRFTISAEAQSIPGQASPATEGGSVDERVTLLMDESDDIWVDTKYDHVARVVPKVQKLLVQLRAEDPAMLAQSGNATNISRAIMSLPKYTELKKRLSSHIALLTAIQSAIGRRRLVEVGALEQDLVCIRPIMDHAGRVGTSLTSLLSGLGAGNPARTWEDEVRKRMLEFLEDQDGCPDIDQLRLICVYAISRSGIPASDIAKYADIAKLLPEDIAAIHNLSLHGARIIREEGVPVGAESSYGRVFAEGREQDHETDADGNVITPLMRHVPVIRTVMEDAARGTLPEDLFPFMRVPGREEGADGSGSAVGASATPMSPPTSPIIRQVGSSIRTTTSSATAVRKDARGVPDDAIVVDLPAVPQAKTGFTTQLTVVKPTWAMKTARDIPTVAGGAASAAEGDGSGSGSGSGALDLLGQRSRTPRVTRGPRVVVFVVGGLTMGEVRCAEDVGAKMAREVVVGSTHIFSPAQFIESLKPAVAPTDAQTLPSSSAMMGGSGGASVMLSSAQLQGQLRRSGTGARMKTLSRPVKRR